MTCIIGLKENNKIYMGCDSYLGGGNWPTTLMKQPKVIKIHNMLIGHTGFPRATQIIQYHLSIRTQNENEDDMFYLITVFADSVRKVFKDLGYSWVNSNHETLEDYFLIGYKNNLYEMHSNFQIVCSLDNYTCIGSGQDYALAAMCALDNLSPEKRIKRSLEITEKFCNTVKAPFNIEII